MNICQAAALGIVLAGGQPLAAEPPTAPNWMAGAWIETKGEAWADEFWTPMRGGVMIGAGRSGKGKERARWEQSRIERGAGGKLTFWVSPNGAKPISFPMVSSSANEIIFANPAHDYPQRIRYWREGRLLNAEISRADGTKATRWQYQPMGN